MIKIRFVGTVIKIIASSDKNGFYTLFQLRTKNLLFSFCLYDRSFEEFVDTDTHLAIFICLYRNFVDQQIVIVSFFSWWNEHKTNETILYRVVYNQITGARKCTLYATTLTNTDIPHMTCKRIRSKKTLLKFVNNLP